MKNPLRMLGVFVTLAILLPSTSSAVSCGAWEAAAPRPADNLYGVAQCNGRIVAVGASGLALVSDDGTHWTRYQTGNLNNINAVACNGSMFVAASKNGYILTSPDGEGWTSTWLAVTVFRAVTWTGSMWVAVGSGPTIVTSPDGVTWTVAYHESHNRESLGGVAGNGSILVATGGNQDVRGQSLVMTSADGITWSRQDLDVDGVRDYAYMNGVAWGNGQFVTAHDAGLVLTSPDGAEWTAHTVEGAAALLTAAWDGARFLVTGRYGKVFTSPDGATWSAGDSGTKASLYGLAVTPTGALAVGDSETVVASDDGTTWSYLKQPVQYYGLYLYSVARGPKTFAAFGMDFGAAYEADSSSSHPYVWLTSQDGRHWTAHPDPNPAYTLAAGMTWGGGQFVAVGDTAYTSVDGATWQRRRTGTASLLFDVAWSGSRYVAVGMDGTVVSSPDGAKWTQAAPDTTATLQGVACSESACVAVGSEGTVLTSTNGLAWSVQSLGEDLTLTDVASDGSQLVAGGVMGVIFTSPDGFTWTRQDSGGTLWINGVAWVGDRFLALGPGILSSPDGVTWTPEAVPPYVGGLQDATEGPLVMGFYGFLAPSCLRLGPHTEPGTVTAEGASVNQ